jgi:DNA-binding CsgD family transcriptional regulator
MQECLIMLCCGFDPERIGEELHISRKTVNNHIGFLYKTFHAENREEMVAIAWELELVTKEDIRFYRRRPVDVPLPEWAEINRRTMSDEE